jgi:uncharacterized protein (TIGR02145 family)
MKMKKMIYLMLTFILLGAASMTAQVTIGADEEPHGGAVLDLSQATGNQVGLLLPNVKLNDTGIWQLGGSEFTGTGMMVYNTNEDIAGEGADGVGIYVWNGLAWKPIDAGQGGLVKVTHYDLAPASPVNVWINGTIDFTATNFRPTAAAYQSVEWEITSGNEFAEITASDGEGCTITGLAEGDAVLTVKTTDGFAAPKTVTIHVNEVTLSSFDLSDASLTIYTLGSNTFANLTASNFKGTDGSSITDVTVTWSVIDGSITTGSVSPESGSNTTTVSAGTAAGTFTVRASAGGITQDVPVTVVGLKSLTLDKTTLAISGANPSGTVAVSQFTGTNDAAMPGMSDVPVSWATANLVGVTSPTVTSSTNGTTAATVSGGSTAGTFNVIATVAGIQSSPCAVTVTTTGGGKEQIGSQIYDTYTYPIPAGSTTTWMVQNSYEGTAAYSSGANKYYSWAQGANACPTGWSVPTQAQWTALQTYINKSATSAEEKAMWNSGAALAGYYYIDALRSYGSNGDWWTGNIPSRAFNSPGGADMYGMVQLDDDYRCTVRCIKDK